jgi:dienelactone hydrolase
MPDDGDDDRLLPYDLLGAIAIQEVEVDGALRHVEIYTRGGLLTLLWHGDQDATRVVLCCGGAMGGLLGPANGLFHDLGRTLAKEGIGTIRVGYRRPNDLPECVLDVAAAADLASRAGAERFVAVGHSFGGAVAIGTAVALPQSIAGVVTLATQSAGCENAGGLNGRPLLLLHGDKDELLPVACSETVRMIAGSGELVVLAGAGHLLSQASDDIRARLLAWLPAVLA